LTALAVFINRTSARHEFVLDSVTAFDLVGDNCLLPAEFSQSKFAVTPVFILQTDTTSDKFSGMGGMQLRLQGDLIPCRAGICHRLV
jgi:hypothetical protein